MKKVFNKILEFIKQMITSGSGVSSKRVAGIIGWMAFIWVIIYCTIQDKQAPLMAETLAICSSALLGLETITNIWNNGKNKNL
jgi:hypothetical protein